ncbi:glycosyltransferase [Oceanicella sp. SM1341]|uniref:glycosyltransferase n=1 Tax=Oceanicella sp. SM1341 TaxID=1548889 RepID=UPI000E4EB2DD|nr:glycosyltransferase [Oceanicella sp. SM1341]
MSSVVFLDTLCPFPYDASTAQRRALGPVETSVVRVAEALSRHHSVTVHQHCWTDRTGLDTAVAYSGMDDVHSLAGRLTCDHLVVLNAPRTLAQAARRFRGGQLWLWLHVLPGRHSASGLGASVVAADAGVIVLSETQRAAVIEHARAQEGIDLAPRVRVIPPPVMVPPLRGPGPETDADQLLFAGGPHEGLDEVIRAFAAVQAQRPSARLVLAHPDLAHSYAYGENPAIRSLGALPHAEMVRCIRESFCMFHAEARLPRAFNLVLAEAAVLGVPAIAHAGLGANDEQIADPRQLIDVTDRAAVTERLDSWWREGRPRPAPRPEWERKAVSAAWRRELAGGVQAA